MQSPGCDRSRLVGSARKSAPNYPEINDATATLGDAKMFSTTKIVLSTALVVSTTFTASAATKPRPTHVHGPAMYDIVPDFSAPSRTRARDYITDPIIVPERNLHRTAG